MKPAAVYRYLDYREYLNDYFESRKQSDPKFSHRYLARRLDLSSPNFIMLVMQGKRSLTSSLAFRISREFKHDAEETEYLQCMIGFDKAQTLDEKNNYFRRMAELRRHTDMDKIDERQFEYYSNWYNLVVRELVVLPGFKDNIAWLAKKVKPPITAAQAKRSIALLLKLGLIRRVGDHYVHESPIISTGPRVTSLAVANYHRTMAGLAAEAIDRVPHEERDLTACTVCLSERGFALIKQALADCRQKILAITEVDDDAEQVFQVGFQLFPLSTKDTVKKSEK